MTADWQNLIALGIVAAAAMHVSFRVWKMFATQEQSNCGGGCHGCTSNAVATNQVTAESALAPLVSLELFNTQRPSR